VLELAAVPGAARWARYDPADRRDLVPVESGDLLFARVKGERGTVPPLDITDDEGNLIVDYEAQTIEPSPMDPADFDIEIWIDWIDSIEGLLQSEKVGETDIARGQLVATGTARVPPGAYFASLRIGYSATATNGTWRLFDPWLAEHEPSSTFGATADQVELLETVAESVADLGNDGIVSRGEKQVWIDRDAYLEGRYQAFSTRATALDLTAAAAAASAARTAYRSYRDGLVPVWDDTSKGTPVLRATHRAAIFAWGDALEALVVAVSEEDATIADWANVYGSDRPEDNADVTNDNVAAGIIDQGDLATRDDVDESYISVPHLSSISAVIGLLRTATSGSRVEIASNQIRVYDGSNTLRVRIGVW
jgi:hypothetical protein